MKTQFFFLILLLFGLSLQKTHAMFPVGQCFDGRANFGLGSGMGFGSNNCCGTSFGVQGGGLLVPHTTIYGFNNPYSSIGMGGLYGGGLYGGGLYPGYGGLGGAGLGIRAGINAGPLTPMLLSLLTGGISIGAGVGINGGYGGYYNGNRGYGPYSPAGGYGANFQYGSGGRRF